MAIVRVCTRVLQTQLARSVGDELAEFGKRHVARMGQVPIGPAARVEVSHEGGR